MCKILIGGDVCPQNRAIGNTDLFDGIQTIAKQADYFIVNLEAPIRSSHSLPIEKRGPNLETPPLFVGILRNAGVQMVTLANNHFLDYGNESAINTIEECHKGGIRTVGGGKDLNEAGAIQYVQVNNSIVAIINCCEHEYSIAKDHTAGSNPLDPIVQSYDIKNAKEKADYVIVIVHGGIENHQLPSPRMKKIYHFFIDCGADAVINHHQHCFSGYEVYKDRPIFYGLGNLSFDWNNQRQTWYEGLLVMLKLDDSEKKVGFDIYFYNQAQEQVGPVLCDKFEYDAKRKRIELLNETIRDDKLLAEEYTKFMDETVHNYDYLISPWSISYTLRLYKKGWLPNYFRRRKWVWLQNALTCESHYERFLHMINNKLNK